MSVGESVPSLPVQPRKSTSPGANVKNVSLFTFPVQRARFLICGSVMMPCGCLKVAVSFSTGMTTSAPSGSLSGPVTPIDCL
jgi:hypothetical protein